MFLVDGGLGLALFVLWVGCLLDVIFTDESQVRTLPKVAWVLVLIFTLDIGAIVWLIAGRTWVSATRDAAAGGRSAGRTAPARSSSDSSPDDDDAFIAQLRERAEYQRRLHAERQRAEADRAHDRRYGRPNPPIPSAGTPEAASDTSGSTSDDAATPGEHTA